MPGFYRREMIPTVLVSECIDTAIQGNHDTGYTLLAFVLPSVTIFIVKDLAYNRTQIKERIQRDSYLRIILVGYITYITDIYCRGCVDIISRGGA